VGYPALDHYPGQRFARVLMDAQMLGVDGFTAEIADRA
jgi:CheY-like chemotaxis protein